jgi:dipeptidyl aminopeptidase/acylaminoacyl peptidase
MRTCSLNGPARSAGLIAAAILAIAARAPRPFTPDDIVTFKSVNNLIVSPDGRRVAFLVREADMDEARPEGNLWIAMLDGSGSPRQITFAKGTESSPAWSPDGRRIAFLARRGDATNVWTMRIDGGEARAFADSKGSFSAFAWSPDGARLAVVGPPEDTEEEARRRRQKDDGYVVGRQWRNHRVWIVRAEGEKPAAVTDGARHVRAVRWSPDGRTLALITTPDPEADAAEEARAEIVDAATGRVRMVPGSSQADAIEWAPGGQALAFTRGFDGRGISRQDLFVWRLDGGAPVNLTAAIDRDIEDLFWRDAGSIVVHYSQGAIDVVATLDASSGLITDMWKPGFSIGDVAPAGAGWAFVRADRPPEVWHVSGDAEPQVLTSLNAAAADLPLGTVEIVKWKWPAGEIEGVLVLPPDFSSSRRYPLIVNPHGGPRGHSQADFDPLSSFFASRGFVVFKPNFRGSTGYGHEFTRGNVLDWGAGPFGDVMAGVDALITRGVADPDRLFIYGWSYGGYLTNWAITHTDRFRAAASGAGVADLRMQYSISDARRWRFDYFKGSPFVGAIDAIYEKESPVTYVRHAKTPTLFIHGAEDVRCPLPQGLMMHRALKDNGVKTEMVVYPREGHGFTEPRHIIDRARRIVEWFRAHDPAERKSTQG